MACVFYQVHVSTHQTLSKPVVTHCHHVPPTTLTPGICNTLICFWAFRILYSIVLKSERFTSNACLRNSLLAYDKDVPSAWILSTKDFPDDDDDDEAIPAASFLEASRNSVRYRASTSNWSPDSFFMAKAAIERYALYEDGLVLTVYSVEGPTRCECGGGVSWYWTVLVLRSSTSFMYSMSACHIICHMRTHNGYWFCTGIPGTCSMRIACEKRKKRSRYSNTVPSTGICTVLCLTSRQLTVSWVSGVPVRPYSSIQ